MNVPLNELLYCLSQGLDFVEHELLDITPYHGLRTAYMSGRICQAMGMSELEAFDMSCCAILHDNALTEYMLESGLGHMGRLDSFINHCANGERNTHYFPFRNDVPGVIMYHHENWDGSGFHNLKGASIPTRATLLRLADNMDLCLSMGNNRPGLLDEMRTHATKYDGSLYSPKAVEALLGILDEEGEDFTNKLDNTNIINALRHEIPSERTALTTEQMLEICGMAAFIIDAKSSFTKNHSRGVAELVSRLSPRFGIKGERADKLLIAAYLHDIGKLATPLGILEKPGPLADDEMEIMHQHAWLTGALLHDLDSLGDIPAWAANHHEKLNGRGYPHGYGANDLSLESRILTCCDVYHALTEERPYRPAMEHEDAMSIARDMAKRGEIDPQIVEAIEEIVELELSGWRPRDN